MHAGYLRSAAKLQLIGYSYLRACTAQTAGSIKLAVPNLLGRLCGPSNPFKRWLLILQRATYSRSDNGRQRRRLAETGSPERKRERLERLWAVMCGASSRFTTKKHAKRPSQRYQLLLQPVLMHQYWLQKQLIHLSSGDQRFGVWYRVKPLPGTKTPV